MTEVKTQELSMLHIASSPKKCQLNLLPVVSMETPYVKSGTQTFFGLQFTSCLFNYDET